MNKELIKEIIGIITPLQKEINKRYHAADTSVKMGPRGRMSKRLNAAEEFVNAFVLQLTMALEKNNHDLYFKAFLCLEEYMLYDLYTLKTLRDPLLSIFSRYQEDICKNDMLQSNYLGTRVRPTNSWQASYLVCCKNITANLPPNPYDESARARKKGGVFSLGDIKYRLEVESPVTGDAAVWAFYNFYDPKKQMLAQGISFKDIHQYLLCAFKVFNFNKKLKTEEKKKQNKRTRSVLKELLTLYFELQMLANTDSATTKSYKLQLNSHKAYGMPGETGLPKTASRSTGPTAPAVAPRVTPRAGRPGGGGAGRPSAHSASALGDSSDNDDDHTVLVPRPSPSSGGPSVGYMNVSIDGGPASASGPFRRVIDLRQVKATGVAETEDGEHDVVFRGFEGDPNAGAKHSPEASANYQNVVAARPAVVVSAYSLTTATEGLSVKRASGGGAAAHYDGAHPYCLLHTTSTLASQNEIPVKRCEIHNTTLYQCCTVMNKYIAATLDDPTSWCRECNRKTKVGPHQVSPYCPKHLLNALAGRNEFVGHCTEHMTTVYACCRTADIADTTSWCRDCHIKYKPAGTVMGTTSSYSTVVTGADATAVLDAFNPLGAAAALSPAGLAGASPTCLKHPGQPGNDKFINLCACKALRPQKTPVPMYHCCLNQYNVQYRTTIDASHQCLGEFLCDNCAMYGY